MLPFSTLAERTTGREGSVSGTVTRSPLCAVAAPTLNASAIPNIATARFTGSVLLVCLQAVFAYMDVSVEILDMDLWSAVADSSARRTVRANDELAVLPLAD